MFTKTLKALAVLAIVAAPLSSALADDDDDERSALAGVYEITIKPDPSSGLPPTITNFATITADGKMINVDPDLGTALGETERIRGRRYAVGFFGFLKQHGMQLTYEVQGTARLKRNGDFRGPFRTIVQDLSGNVLFSYEGVVEGARLGITPY